MLKFLEQGDHEVRRPEALATGCASLDFMVNRGLFLFNIVLFLSDTCFLTYKIAQIVKAGATDSSPFENLYFADIRRMEREDPFNTDTIRNFPYGEGFCSTFTFYLDNITSEVLETLFVSFYDFIAHDDVVARLEIRKVRFAGDFVVYKLDHVHIRGNLKKRAAKIVFVPTISDLKAGFCPGPP